MIPNQLKSCFVTMAMAGPMLTHSPMQMRTGILIRKKLTSFLRLRRHGMAALRFIGSKYLFRQTCESGRPSCYGFQRSKFFAEAPCPEFGCV